MFMHLLKCAKLVFKPRLTSGYTTTAQSEEFLLINDLFTSIFISHSSTFSIREIDILVPGLIAGDAGSIGISTHPSQS